MLHPFTKVKTKINVHLKKHLKMNKKLLFLFQLLILGNSIQAKNLSFTKTIDESLFLVVNPTANMTGSTTICPRNTAVITITGTPNSVVEIRNLETFSLYTATISSNGTGTFVTPMLNQTTTFSLIKVTEFSTSISTIITGITVTINVVPNGCANVTTNINVNPNDFPICNVGECRTLIATSTPIPSTTTYEVSSIPYFPQASFLEFTYNVVNATGDDIWSAPITLPFNFSFFDQNYTSCQVGTNGLITFNPQTHPGFCEWNINNNIPNPAFANLNSILGVFQDTETRVSGGQAPPNVSVNWKLTGVYPCRKLIVNFYDLGQFSCNQTVGLQTSQIVLYEVSNIIEVYVQNRTRCATWQNGKGIIGVINNAGTLAFVPPGRNANDTWTATNEAWRFTPNGPNVPVAIRWLENGNQIGNGSTITVCPQTLTSYIAEATYTISGVPFIVNSAVNTIAVSLDETQNPNDLSVCFDTTGNYTVDLTSNVSTILGGLNPNDYEVSFFTSLVDAENFTNFIINPSNFTFSQNQTIYVGIYNIIYGCYYIKPFQLSILDVVPPPTGISPQSLNVGQTIANLVVSGQNIQWYDAPQGGNLLPNNTIAQNNVTYYASQTVNDCESRISQNTRRPILVQVNLDASEFDQNAFSLYPNPTNDILTITSNLSEVTLDVYTIISQKIETKILSNGSNIINLSNLSTGVYLFQLSLDGKTITYKIVKN